ncbi:hypothetical protein NQZ68_000526 [Dissostichus eleginoides]|nr:hypothetical protein NQZ68_000526 [Dissostichus eleginoides]
MVYVSNGQVLDSRLQSPWRLSLLVDFFWGAVDFIGLFFKSMINPDVRKDGSGVLSRFSDGKGIESCSSRSPWWQKTNGKNKPRCRAQLSTNGRRRMRKVNAYTFSVGAGLCTVSVCREPQRTMVMSQC